MQTSDLGGKPIWNFVTGNNALPRTHGLRQPVHKDITFFHPQVCSLKTMYTFFLILTQCPFFVIANVPLCDFSPANGSTEFWLGSHAHTSGHDQVIATDKSTLANARLISGEPETFVLPNVVEKRREERSGHRFNLSVRREILC
jgi:ectoine hydroxylase-related dioxygenase (phytanoyl-CoA dioxygenase family)